MLVIAINAMWHVTFQTLDRKISVYSTNCRAMLFLQSSFPKLLLAYIICSTAVTHYFPKSDIFPVFKTSPVPHFIIPSYFKYS